MILNEYAHNMECHHNTPVLTEQRLTIDSHARVCSLVLRTVRIGKVLGKFVQDMSYRLFQLRCHPLALIVKENLRRQSYNIIMSYRLFQQILQYASHHAKINLTNYDRVKI